MANCKGTNVVFFRTLWQSRPSFEKQFRDGMSSEAREAYDSALPISWVPDQVVAEMEESAAAVLFPDEPNGLQNVGRLQAKHDLGGIYNVLLRITTVPVLIKKSARLWSTYHDQGNADIADQGARTATLLVMNYPDLPRSMRQVTTGYVAGAVEMTRARDVDVALNERDPRRWAWVVTWG